MSDRPTASTITDPQLDELYEQLTQAREGERILGARVNDWITLATRHQHWGQRRWNAWKSARSRAQEQRERAGRAEAAIVRVRQLHHPTGVVAAAEAGVEPDCAVCGPNTWPCPTYNATIGLKPAPPKEKP